MAPAISENKDFKHGWEEFKNAYKRGLATSL